MMIGRIVDICASYSLLFCPRSCEFSCFLVSHFFFFPTKEVNQWANKQKKEKRRQRRRQKKSLDIIIKLLTIGQAYIT